MTTTTHPTGRDNAGAERARPEMLDVKAVAGLLACSPRSVYRLADGGKMPRPVKLGSLVRWRGGELRDWIADGCPVFRPTMKGGAK